MMLRIKIALLLMLLSFSVACILSVNNNVDESSYTICSEDILQNSSTLLDLISDNSSSYIGKSNKILSGFQSCFRLELTSVDIRVPDYVTFSFDCNHPETTIQVTYCSSDQFLVPPDHFVTASNQQVRIEHLGITDNGYIHCIRILDNWFYVESFLPT